MKIEAWWETRDRTNLLEEEFFADMMHQSSTESSRGKAIILRDLSEPTEVTLESPIELFRGFDHDRVLVILEDLGREFVERFGSQMGIPVHVFALHWARPEHHVLGQARLPVGQPPEQHFVLHYRQYLPFRLTDSDPSNSH